MTRNPGMSVVREVGYRRHGNVAVIQAPEYFDVYNAPRVRETAIVLQAGGVTGIVFDLAAVVLIDTAALGVIAGTSSRLRPAGGPVAVVGAATQVARLLTAAGLARTVLLLPTPEEAVSALHQPPGPTGEESITPELPGQAPPTEGPAG